MHNASASQSNVTQKVRREVFGGTRAEGHRRQREGRRIRAVDARAVRVGARDDSLSSVGGLVPFFSFVQTEGVAQELGKSFGHLKRGRGVVYGMGTQLLLLVGVLAAGQGRVFGLEALASDPVFRHLAGGAVPSIDVVYDDLRRFQKQDLDALENMVVEQGLLPVSQGSFDELTLDVDTTVTPLFGEQQGAEKGYNPKYRARPSHQPLLGRIAETGTVVLGRLRPGDRGLGQEDADDVVHTIDAVHRASPNSILTVRIDAGGDNGPLLDAIDSAKSYFLVKARLTANLLGSVSRISRWVTVEESADGSPARQVAEVPFRRDGWGQAYRVFAVRTCERESGKQVYLWHGLDLSVSVYVTNDTERDADTLARLYDDRAGIELLIRELKESLGIGKASSEAFDANDAMLLLKLLTYNLLRRWAASLPPFPTTWSLHWFRAACILVPARLLQIGGRRTLRMAPRPMLN